MIERLQYIDAQHNPDLAASQSQNLIGQLRHHYDSSGLVSHERFDFKGNLLEAQRTLACAYQAPVIDWSQGSPTAVLEDETFVQITEYDALNRMARQYNWHSLMPNSRVAVYEPR